MNNTGHKIPVLRSFNEIVSMTIGFILLLSASTHCSAAGSFLEDSVNNGNMPRRKRIGARKPVESSVLCFLALRKNFRQVFNLLGLSALRCKKYITVSVPSASQNC